MKNYNFDSEALYSEKNARGGSRIYKYKLNRLKYDGERLLILDILNPRGYWEENNQIVVSENDFKKYFMKAA